MEVAMNNMRQAAQAHISRRHHGLAILRSMIAAWDKRKRFRRELAQISHANPHLIDDIGLTGRQVRTEIAKHFWQA